MSYIFPVEVLNIIFKHAPCASAMFVCKHWAELIYALCTNIDVVRSYRAVADLPAMCWPMMTMPQRAALPGDIRRRDSIHALGQVHLKSKYVMTWSEIMTFCRGGGDVDWLLHSRWWRFANTLMNIHAILFLDCEQFRTFSLTYGPQSSRVQLVNISDVDIYSIQFINVMKAQYQCNMLSFTLPTVAAQDIMFICHNNTVLASVTDVNGNVIRGVTESISCDDKYASVSEHIAYTGRQWARLMLDH
jgi:hypothetical protein